MCFLPPRKSSQNLFNVKLKRWGKFVSTANCTLGFFWRKSTKLKSFDCHSKITSKVSGTCRTLPNALSEQINAVAWLKCLRFRNSKIQLINSLKRLCSVWQNLKFSLYICPNMFTRWKLKNTKQNFTSLEHCNDLWTITWKIQK